MSKQKTVWQSTVYGTLWVYLTTYGGKAIVFVSTIVLARLLLKEDFGVAGYAITVIGFLNVINDFGLRTTVIYLPESKQTSNASFALNVLISLILLGLTWLLAPWFGRFFQDDRAVTITRVLALTLPVFAFGNTHDALLRKRMDFDKKAIPDTAKVVVKAIVAISMALLGYGYWSLIVGQIAGSLFWVVLLWWVVPWRPTLAFEVATIRPMLRYSGSIFTMSAFAMIFTNADYLLIGRYLGATSLGIYTLAFRLPELLVQEFPIIVHYILFPAFSKIGKDSTAFKTNLLKSIRYTVLVTLPLGIGLALTAKPFVLFGFSEKWAASIPITALIAIQMTLMSLIFNFGIAYKVQGRPEILSRLVFVRILILLPALWWAMEQIGTVVAVAYTHVAVSCIVVIIELLAAVYILGLPWRALVAAYTPAFSATLIMAVVVLLINYAMEDTPPLLHLLTAVIVGGCAYCGSLLWLQKDTVAFIGQRLRSVLVKS